MKSEASSGYDGLWRTFSEGDCNYSTADYAGTANTILVVPGGKLMKIDYAGQ